jgi:hypothetical protein
MGKVHAFHKSLFCHWLVLISHCQFCPALMDKKSWSVHSEMEPAEKPVQNAKKKRSQSDKIGRLKYNQQLLKQTLQEVEEVKLMLRTIFVGLKDSFNFERSLVEHVACVDEIDREILGLLFEAGSPGLLPKDLACKLEKFNIKSHQISRRILKMNKKLEKEFGEHIAEQRGWHWALTNFTFESCGENENDKD